MKLNDILFPFCAVLEAAQKLPQDTHCGLQTWKQKERKMREDDREEYRYNKKVVILIVAAVSVIVILIAAYCFLDRVKVEAGQEAVLIDKPFFFGKGGVQKQSVQAGAVWVWCTTSATMLDVRPVQNKEFFDDIMTSDNVPVDFNTFVKVKIKDGQTPYLLEKFGANWYQNNLQQIIRTEVRDAVAKHPMTALTTRSDVINDVQRNIFKEVESFISKSGLPVILMEVILEKVTPPANIVGALAETAAQQQRAKTEIERAKAEEQRKDAEVKRASADNAYRNALGLSSEQFVDLEAVKAYKDAANACAQAKGDCTIIVGKIPGAGNLQLK